MLALPCMGPYDVFGALRPVCVLTLHRVEIGRVPFLLPRGDSHSLTHFLTHSCRKSWCDLRTAFVPSCSLRLAGCTVEVQLVVTRKACKQHSPSCSKCCLSMPSATLPTHVTSRKPLMPRWVAGHALDEHTPLNLSLGPKDPCAPSIKKPWYLSGMLR